MQYSRLTTRLNVMRTTIRRRLILHGACSVLAGGVASFMTVVTADWLLRFPGALRILVAALFFLGMVGAIAYWIVKPLRAPMGVSFIASRLERYFGDLQDRLVSTVDFTRQGEHSSPALVRRVVDDTDRLLDELPLETALTRRPLVVRTTVFLVVAIASAIVVLSSPGWARTGLYRYVMPFSGIDWPRRVEIVPLTGDQSVAVGESVSVKMAVARGMDPAIRAVVHLREPGGKTFSQAMQRDPESNEFDATIDAVTKDLKYWFEAGDNSTRGRPFSIHAVRRPEVMEALATIEPPPYASDRPVRTQDLMDAPLTAPVGGFVTIRVRASKPIPPRPTAADLGLRRDSGELIPLQPVAGKPDELTARIEVVEDVTFRIELRDELGFENRGAQTFTLSAIPDAVPTIMILEPRSLVELTPHGAVDLVLRVEDDFGIEAVDLHVESTGETLPQVIPLTGRRAPAESSAGVANLISFRWRVEPEASPSAVPDPRSLNPGDDLVYWATATDNRVWNGLVGQIGQSAHQRIKIISESEFDSRIRDELAILERRLQETTLDQAAVRDAATALADRPEPAMDASLRNQLGSLSARQAKLIRSVQIIANRFARLADRMARNQPDAGEFRGRLGAMDDALVQVSSGPMAAAGTALSGAAEPLQPEPWKNLVKQAADSQDETVARLNDLLHTMAQWGSFQELMTRTRDLLRRQDAVRDETIALGKSLLGKALASLKQHEEEALKLLERRQEQVANDVEDMLKNMGRIGQEAEQKNRAAAESIDDALRAAGARDLTKRLQSAEEAIARNRTAAAVLDQKAASDALREMVAALEDRQRRELAQLKIQLRRAEDQVAQLIEQQTGLKRATEEAAMLAVQDESLDSYAQRQHVLSVNARLLGEEFSADSKIAGSARIVRSAEAPMLRAEASLRERQPEQAQQGQTEALEVLEQARAALEELARRTAEEEFRQSLYEIRQGLEGVRAAQAEVNGELTGLRSRIETAGQLTRREAREATKLAQHQSAVVSRLDGLRSDLQKVPVYEWALERVGQWMGTSRDWLASRKLDDELVATTDRILHELDKLIGAIRAAEAMPTETEFAEAEGGGSGQGQAQAAPSLPTVTELLVLKTMQADVNERTRALHESVDRAAATENQLRDLKMVGEDQAAVRRLTELVLDKTR